MLISLSFPGVTGVLALSKEGLFVLAAATVRRPAIPFFGTVSNSRLLV